MFCDRECRETSVEPEAYLLAAVALIAAATASILASPKRGDKVEDGMLVENKPLIFIYASLLVKHGSHQVYNSLFTGKLGHGESKLLVNKAIGNT